MRSTWTGRGRIAETDLWNDDSFDLLEPAYIEFGDHRLGSMVVGALQAGIDYRICERDGRPTIEFLFIHQGDEVVMTGVPTEGPPALTDHDEQAGSLWRSTLPSLTGLVVCHRWRLLNGTRSVP